MAGVWQCGDHPLGLDGTLVMGILNVTPDSFSDGGCYATAEDAIGAGLLMASEGASIIDVGGESTRPGADDVSVEEEIDRVLPVVRGLAADDIVVSIDTRNPQTARVCLDAGASIVNDVSGFRDDAMVEVVAASGCGCIVMHMLGEPKTMQSERPEYFEVVEEIQDYLVDRTNTLLHSGVPAARIAVDPGIGFGKLVGHNLEIIRRIDAFREVGYPVVLGASRKSFVGAVLDTEDAGDRLEGSLAVAAYAALTGVDVLRVHDVRETARTLEMLAAIDVGGAWLQPDQIDPIAPQREQESEILSLEAELANMFSEPPPESQD